jgi:4-hydroxy-tetrahydrodipicolinate reductase
MKDKINILMAGLPGKMATKVAEKILEQEDMSLNKFALTGYITEEKTEIKNETIHLAKPAYHASFLERLFSGKENLILVDYSQPDVVNMNAELYCKCKIPFVMGTTGGDRKKLEEVVKNSEISAVIAPNMAKQIVGFQAMMQSAAENFPDLFKDYTLEIVESHQQGKKDTSGTAKAMVSYFSKLGVLFPEEPIKMIRNPEEQKALGIPEEYLSGHGWHTYTLKSKDETVKFQFTHNVNGRDIYALGTLDAIRFLHNKFYKNGIKGKVYSMIDVLKGN